jgi:hypothetical protein
MVRLNPKILAITLACLLVSNLATGAAAVIGHCEASMVNISPMAMDHCDGMLDFTFPIQGCCGDCNNIFCDLMKNPLRDANAANASHTLVSCYPIFLGSVNPIDASDSRLALCEQRFMLSAAPAWSQIPLYIEHLALII